MKYTANLFVLLTFLWSTLAHAIPPVDPEGREFRAELLQKELSATPTTPASGKRKIYPKSDGYYQLDSTGTETKVGSGSGGGTENFLTATDAETATTISPTTGWFTFNDAISQNQTLLNNGTVDEIGDYFNVSAGGPGFKEGQAIVYTTTGSPVGGLTSGTTYYARNLTGTTAFAMQFSATPTGSIIDLTGEGTGIHTFSPVVPYDGTGGTSTLSLAFATVALGWLPLEKTSSFIFGKTTANSQGQGWSQNFAINAAAAGKRLTLVYDYGFQIGAGTFAEGDLKWAVLDVTNGTLCDNVKGTSVAKHLSNSQSTQFVFDSHAGVTSYRLIAYIASNATTQWSMVSDSYSLGRNSVTTGPPMSPTSDTYGVTTSLTTNVNVASTGRRNGDRLQATFQAIFTGANTQGVSVFLPSGLKVDSTKLKWGSGGGYRVQVGIWTTRNPGSGNTVTGAVMAYNVGADPAIGMENFFPPSNTPFTVVTNQEFTFTIDVPIVGWDTNMVLSNTTANPQADVEVQLTGGAAVSAGSTEMPGTAVRDTVGCWDGYACTVKEDGKYNISISNSWSGGAGTTQMYLNNVASDALFTTPTANYYGSGNVQKYLKAGTRIAFKCQGGNTIGGGTAYVSKINSGTQTIGYQYTAPQVYTFTSGSGTFTIPNGASYLQVRAVAGGGGGSGAGQGTGTQGGVGSNTTFGPLTTYGGLPANGTSSGSGDGGPIASISAPAYGTALKGNPGGSNFYSRTQQDAGGATGGASPFGGAGIGARVQSGYDGSAAQPNSGSGGGGGGFVNTSNAYTGGGGGSGSYVDARIPVTSSTPPIAYSVGGGGFGGAASTAGGSGGAGGSGYIEVTVYFSNAGDSTVPQDIVRSNKQGLRIETIQFGGSGSNDNCTTVPCTRRPGSTGGISLPGSKALGYYYGMTFVQPFTQPPICQCNAISWGFSGATNCNAFNISTTQVGEVDLAQAGTYKDGEVSMTCIGF